LKQQLHSGDLITLLTPEVGLKVHLGNDLKQFVFPGNQQFAQQIPAGHQFVNLSATPFNVMQLSTVQSSQFDGTNQPVRTCYRNFAPLPILYF